MSDAKKLVYFQWGITLGITLLFALIALKAWPQPIITDEAMRWSFDTDPWLRLTLIRDWLDEGGWYAAHEMTRSNAPFGGTISPWTKPLDVIIASISLLMNGDASTRLIKASLCLSPMFAGLWVLGFMQAAKRLMPAPDHVLLAVLILSLLPLSWNYFAIAAADHHTLLAVCFIWVIALLLGSRSPKSGMIAGAILGLMVWISVEAFIPIAIILACLGALWIMNRKPETFLKCLLGALAATTTLAIMLERPPLQWANPFYDTISMAHAAAFWLVFIGFVILSALPLHAPQLRALTAIIIASLIGACMWCIYPMFFSGPMVGLHPYIYSDFLPNIGEAQPLWASIPELHGFIIIAHPLLSLTLMAQMIRTSSWKLYGSNALMLFCITICLLGACFFQVRWYYYLAPLLALSFSVPLAALYNPKHSELMRYWPVRAIGAFGLQKQIILRISCLMALVGISLVPLISSEATQDNQANNKAANNSELSTQCHMIARAMIRSGELEKALGTDALTVLLSTDLGTEILFFTPYRIVASNYHREGAAIEYVWEANGILQVAELKSYLAKRSINVILTCPPSAIEKGGLLEQLALGTAKPPSWMQPVDVATPQWEALKDNTSLPRIYRITK